MKVFLYDGSFEGMLSTFFHILKCRESFCSIEKSGLDRPVLFSESEFIPTDNFNAEYMAKAICSKISVFSFQNIIYSFLSEKNRIEDLLFSYVICGFRTGTDTDRHLSNKTVYSVNEISRKVSFECHKLKGLLRFSELKDGSLYAPVEPDYNIVSILSKHFERRLCNEVWMINDVKRGHAVLYRNHNLEFLEVKDIEITKNTYSEQESTYRQLWKAYFESIAIRERTNPKLQRAFMPQRYWKYLTEKN